MDPGLYLRGIELFNRGEFFEAHEVLEDVWRNAPAPDKRFFQGLVQIAVAFVHHSRGNATGACSLLERGCMNLSGYPALHEGIDVKGLIDCARSWRAALVSAAEPPPLPQIKP